MVVNHIIIGGKCGGGNGDSMVEIGVLRVRGMASDEVKDRVRVKKG